MKVSYPDGSFSLQQPACLIWPQIIVHQLNNRWFQGNWEESTYFCKEKIRKNCKLQHLRIIGLWLIRMWELFIFLRISEVFTFIKNRVQELLAHFRAFFSSIFTLKIDLNYVMRHFQKYFLHLLYLTPATKSFLHFIFMLFSSLFI